MVRDDILAVDHFLSVQDTDFYKEGIQTLHEHWANYLNAEEDGVVKEM